MAPALISEKESGRLFDGGLNDPNRTWRRLALFLANSFVNFFAVDRDFAGRLHTQPDLIAFYTQYRNVNVVANYYGFSDSSRKYQHIPAPQPCSLLIAHSPIRWVTSGVSTSLSIRPAPALND